MSTRSGKRIHNSFHENMLKPDREPIVNSERKTRSRRMKENVEEVISEVKSSKRMNYVSYPTDTDEDVGTDTVDSKDEGLVTRMTRKNALLERNVATPTNTIEANNNVKKILRTTRRTRKFTEDVSEDAQEQNHVKEEEIIDTEKSKKGKKKKKHVENTKAVKEETVSKKKSKKKKGRRSSSIIVEDVEPEMAKLASLNKSNISIDSFHSAAGSPSNVKNGNSPSNMAISPDKNSEITKTFESDDQHTEEVFRRSTRSFTRSGSINISNTPNNIFRVSRKRKSSAIENIELETLNNTLVKSSKKHKLNVMDIFSNEPIDSLNHDEEIKDTPLNLEIDLEERKSIKNTTFDKITSENINTTYDKDESNSESRKSVKDTTFHKNNVCEDQIGEKNVSCRKSQTCKSLINTTFEMLSNSSHDGSVKNNSIRRKSSQINTTYEKSSDTDSIEELKIIQNVKDETFYKDEFPSDINFKPTKEVKNQRKSSQKSLSSQLNSTFEKLEKFDSTFINSEKLNSTFDKDKNLNTTFDKKSKSSLLSSDNSNITLDKSDVSRISITSDESKEIMNTTPVLIESSMDESQINTSKLSPKSQAQAPLTPLKREGTFTKDGPEVTESLKCKTPTKRLSLPSPGCTPFPASKSSSKEKSVLNVTRSIEKSRRSSLAEPLPRTTKVMFCSPVNNPIVVMQQTRKVIKSNLKGSNKSFVFDETLSVEARAAPRKRSHTHSEAEEARAKRKRLAEGLQHSGPRLSRHRTSSASGKLAEPVTPSKKTPSKSRPEARVSRTKLPNFAALHQKNFDKMESLDECQERKAKRARHLLTPTGAVTMLERTSPKDTVPDPPKPQKPEPKVKETKKPETPVKSLPTLKSLNPGYTRFGFKLNLDANPFTIQSKHEMSRSEGDIFNFSRKKNKSKDSIFRFSSKKDNNKEKLTRQVTVPSIVGTTSVRKEVAKKAVREKSFTDKRIEKRNDNRNENRTVIKGVRTNRRFDLQMRMRNLD